MIRYLLRLYFHKDGQDHRTALCGLVDVISQIIANPILHSCPIADPFYSADLQSVEGNASHLFDQIFCFSYINESTGNDVGSGDNFTAAAFEYLDSQYAKVLTSGGNVYSWKYVDYITDAATDSSRHARSCATVPFLGIVLHGYVEFAGSAINMEGNIDYALLRAIENGASLKFILSYRNTQKLKQYYETSIYYSVRYDIWK